MGVHHIGVAVRDMKESIRFYRDGLGCQILFEQVFEKDWQRLVGSPASRMRAVLVAHPENPACAIELIAFEDGVKRSPRTEAPTGLFLVAFTLVDVPGTRARLAELGFGGFEEEFSEIGGHRIDVTFVRDPDGTVVELASLANVRAAGV